VNAGIIVAGILTLAIFTFLYRDNPIYKMAESALIGVSIGYVLVITWSNTLMDILFTPLLSENRLSLVIPMALGLCMFGRFHRETSSWSRLPMAVLIGSGAGVAIPAMLEARTIRQIAATAQSVSDGTGMVLVSALVAVLGVLSTLAYFYFSREHEGLMGRAAKLGTMFLMLFFGTTFGYTVMSRMSTLIGRVDFLLSDFLRLTN